MSSGLPLHFRFLAGANLAAQSAEQLSLAAVPLVAVLALNAGPGEIGFLAAIQTLPFLLLSIPLGLLADRTSRRKLMVGAEVLRALSLFGLLGALLFDQLSINLLALLGFLGAVGTVGAPRYPENNALAAAVTPPVAWLAIIASASQWIAVSSVSLPVTR